MSQTCWIFNERSCFNLWNQFCKLLVSVSVTSQRRLNHSSNAWALNAFACSNTNSKAFKSNKKLNWLINNYLLWIELITDLIYFDILSKLKFEETKWFAQGLSSKVAELMSFLKWLSVEPACLFKRHVLSWIAFKNQSYLNHLDLIWIYERVWNNKANTNVWTHKLQ